MLRLVARLLNMGLNTIFGSFMPLRLHMRLVGSEGDYTVEGTSPQHLATWVHEHTHFFQSIFTGYGHIAWDSYRQITSFLIGQWRNGVLPTYEGKQRIPLAHFAKLSPQHLNLALIADKTCRNLINLGRARFWLNNPDIALGDLSMLLVNQQWKVNPTITVSGYEHTLQGKEITEGHAQFVEATFLETRIGSFRSDVWDRSSLPKQYWIALDWFLEQCGEKHYYDFPFLCDLALQTSWDPVIPRTENDWQASNPSWRFVKLTQALKQRDGLTVGGPIDWPDKYGTFSDELLKACEFRPIEQVLSERLLTLNRKPELMKLEELMKQAITFRMNVPWCGGNPAADTNLFQQLINLFPAPMIEIDGRLVTSGKDKLTNSEVIMELQFQVLASQILGDFSPAAVKEGAIECAFAKYDIPRGCEYQVAHGCPGRYRPSDGSPYPVEKAKDGTLSGCSFEMLLNAIGLRSIDLDVDHLASFPIKT